MSTAGSIPGDLAERYIRFAEDEAHGRSPLYEALARDVAHDAEVVTLLSALPLAKQQSNLLFAAVRSLEGTSENFADFKRRLPGNAEAVRSVMLARDIERRLLAAGWTRDLGAPRLTAWDDLPRAMADPAEPERMAWHIAISRHGGETVLFRLSCRHVRDSALSHMPVLKQLATALPGSGLTALRLRRLSEVAAQACSPLGTRR